MPTLEPKPLQALIEVLQKKKLTVSFAESCTGGKLSAAFAEIPGVSEIFLGSVISYSNQAKIDLLGVRRDTLEDEGAVSASVAGQMARGARQQLHSDWSVAITGIAGPSGGTADKPVGTVWFGICGPRLEETQLQKFSGTRLEIQKASVNWAIEWLKQCLERN